MTGRAIGYWSQQLVQQDPLPTEITSKSGETGTFQGQHLVWHPSIICAERVAEPSMWSGDQSWITASLGTTVWQHLGPRKGARLSCAWGGARSALMLISVYQTGSPRSSNWHQSWSSTWAQSPSSAVWPLATHCLPGTAWSCARLTALCSRYCPMPLPHHHLHVDSSLKSIWGCWGVSD